MLGFRKDGSVAYYKWWSSVSKPEVTKNSPFKCGIEKEKTINIRRGKNDFYDYTDPYISYENFPVVFLNMGKIAAAGGYWDGRLNLHSTENDSIIDTYYNHTETITCLISDDKENFLISGTKSGECILWEISPELTKLSPKFHFFDHDNRINHIFISKELKLFATASDDGKINIYNYVIGKLMRTIHHPDKLPIKTVALTSSPLPSVLFFSDEDRSLYSYSINGRLLEQLVEESQHMMSPLILKDLNFNEVFVYGNEKGELYMRELPFL
mmetsp:Transcript_11172/g.9550  ORF Transcript_11172/g.9550 Transcript_11172/m.9550 type:complete len:269 (-) Transcript_11172:505-1311(-)